MTFASIVQPYILRLCEEKIGIVNNEREISRSDLIKIVEVCELVLPEVVANYKIIEKNFLFPKTINAVAIYLKNGQDFAIWVNSNLSMYFFQIIIKQKKLKFILLLKMTREQQSKPDMVLCIFLTVLVL